MRIISGKLKGRQLVSFNADHIRPTTDRVKESVFNILAGNLIEARVLDLFSGTGNLAIESFSRGAKYVECVESHKLSLRIIRENLQKLNIEKDIRVISKDVFSYLKSYALDKNSADDSSRKFDVIFIDPPFTETLAHKCMSSIQNCDILSSDGVIVIESKKKERIDDVYGRLFLLDRRTFGDKVASFFAHSKKTD